MIACLKLRGLERAGAEWPIRPARSCELRRGLVQPHGRAGGVVHRILDGARLQDRQYLTERPRPYSTAKTWAQTTIIPTNRVIDASAAASSTTARIMMHPLFFEHRGNIVHDMFR